MHRMYDKVYLLNVLCGKTKHFVDGVNLLVEFLLPALRDTLSTLSPTSTVISSVAFVGSLGAP